MTSIVHTLFLTAFLLFGFPSCDDVDSGPIHDNLPDISGYLIVSTNQTKFFNDYQEIAAPVPGEPFYGQDAHYDGNLPRYLDNGDGTVTDHATGLMWCKYDSGDETFAGGISGYSRKDGSMNWQEALHFSENITFAGYGDWRLPDAKELHSILDYSRSPDATDSPALDPVFVTTGITNEAGQDDFPAFWSSTTFKPGRDAIVIYFGRAMGYFDPDDPMHNSHPVFLDVHGAGCQRTDPKSGIPDYGHGPQGDVRRVYNYVRLVRNP